MRHRKMISSTFAVLVLAAATAAGASAKQVELFEPGSSTPVPSSQHLGTILSLDLESGRATCQDPSAGSLERWLPELEAPPLKTTLFYDSNRSPGDCTSEVSGETIDLYGSFVKISLTGATRATAITGFKLHEYQPNGLYCSYATPYRMHLTTVSGEDETEWSRSLTLKRDRLESDAECPATLAVEATVGVSGASPWGGVPLETRVVA